MKHREPYYCYLNDIDIIAKKEDHVPYIYVKGKGWVVDNDNLMMDRIMDWGTHRWYEVDDISEEEALKFIEQLEAGKKPERPKMLT